MPLEKIISGGQTGVDRAGLDAGLALGFSLGGWCPKGRRAEDGPISLHYPLKETSSGDYRQRTEENVLLGDATLILNRGALQGGTALTLEFTTTHQKPCRVIDLNQKFLFDDLVQWIEGNNISVLNIAGPRESKEAGIYEQAKNFLTEFLKKIKEKNEHSN